MTATTDSENSDQETARLQPLGITVEKLNLYRYKTHVYQKLSDAVKYAELDAKRETPDPEAPTSNPFTSEGTNS